MMDLIYKFVCKENCKKNSNRNRLVVKLDEKIEFDTELDKNGQERLRVRITTNKGQLIEVLYQYESFLDNHWVNIVRYDCFHGFFHRDIMLPNGDKEKYEIAIDSLKTASKYAEQDLKDRWEWYREQYLKRMKRRKKDDK